MANNRMYLLHRPTGLAVYLARHAAGNVGWSSTDVDAVLQEFFDKTEGQPNDFCIAMENCSGAPLAFKDWTYTESRGLLRTLSVGKTATPNAL